MPGEKCESWSKRRQGQSLRTQLRLRQDWEKKEQKQKTENPKQLECSLKNLTGCCTGVGGSVRAGMSLKDNRAYLLVFLFLFFI